VYRADIWWGDGWDPRTYARDVDFSRPFLEQFGELMKEVPLSALYTIPSTMVNSEYCNAATGCKNSYLCFRTSGAEESAYLNTIVDAKECFDSSFLNHSELCYESVRIRKCSQAFFSENCEECSNVWFSRDLIGCSDCFGCANLRGKQYCVYNEQKTKEEFQAFMKSLDLGTVAAVEEQRRRASEAMVRLPRRSFHGRSNLNVSGDYISNSKNVRNSFMLNNGENLRYCQFLKDGPSANSYDWSFFGDAGEWIYESCWVGLSTSTIKFSAWMYGAHDCEYCFGCHNSGFVFGSVGVRKGEYYILNKPYEKAEYHDMVARIKKHMDAMPYKDRLGREYRYGEMLPAEFSPWCYNESTASERFPLDKQAAVAKGFNWREPDTREYQQATAELPEHIKEVADGILKEILRCSVCTRNYRLIPNELQFYRRFNLPVPSLCFFCRDQARIDKVNSMEVYLRTCARCGKDMETSYPPERPEIVYCEKCYQAEVA
jgi:hypothetical protein